MFRLVLLLLVSLFLVACDTVNTVNDNTSDKVVNESASVLGEKEFEIDINLYTDIISDSFVATDSTSYTETDWYYDGIDAMIEGGYEYAIECFDNVKNTDAKYIDSLDAKGMAYAKLGQTENSIASFDEAISLDPNKWEYYYNRANAYGIDFYFREAMQDLDKVLELNPGHKESIQLINFAKGHFGN